jgi:hypothetical protein
MSVVIGGKYEHYKGKPYRVLAVAKRDWTEKPADNTPEIMI